MSQKKQSKQNKQTETVSKSTKTSGFKLSKLTKRIMALQYSDSHQRGAYKRSMIEAEKTFQTNRKKQVQRVDLSDD